MFLSDRDIRELLSNGQLSIEPIEDIQIQPASIDIRLGNSFSVIENRDNEIVKMDSEITCRTFKSETILLRPKQFVLATTMEYLRLPDNLTAFVEGRSSIGRLGVFIQNAGWVDPGFEGEITLELFNASDYVIELCAGRRLGQLVFSQMSRSSVEPYCGKYQGQSGATGSLIQLDKEIKQQDAQIQLN